MICTPSFKLFVLVAAFLVTVLVQNSYAQIEDDGDDVFFGGAITCPNEYLLYYKNCRGAIDECSTCVGNAEKTCRDELTRQGKNASICYSCTNQAAFNCDNLKFLCTGDQECTNANNKCIDYVCTYVQPSK